MIRVLLVDDHDLVRVGIKSLLATATGIEVIGEARNGEDAIKMTKELSPDVVVMDVSMPVMDGVEATRRLCAQDRAEGGPSVSQHRADRRIVGTDPQRTLRLTGLVHGAGRRADQDRLPPGIDPERPRFQRSLASALAVR